jgi:hypothetical protein
MPRDSTVIRFRKPDAIDDPLTAEPWDQSYR